MIFWAEVQLPNALTAIEVTEDGTISANAKVSEDQIATSDDTSEMLKEIYGE